MNWSPPAFPTPPAGNSTKQPATTEFVTLAVANSTVGVFTATTSGIVPASGTGTTNYLRADGSWSPVAVLQVLQATYTTNTGLSAVIPLDDTTPLVSEGTQILSQAITLRRSSNNVLVEFSGMGSVSSVNTALSVSMFRDSTCIQARVSTFPTQNFPMTIQANILDAPATTTITYSVRVGPSANTASMNGATTARYFGGASACTLTLKEIAA